MTPEPHPTRDDRPTLADIGIVVGFLTSTLIVFPALVGLAFGGTL
jgi:hypothetical protein